MRQAFAGIVSGLSVLLFAVTANAHGWGDLFGLYRSPPWAQGPGNRSTQSFNRIATFANYRNQDRATETVSEIVAATADGRTLVYTDAATGSIGFVDISNAENPIARGTFFAGDGAEPTSVDVLGNLYALAAVNTSDSFIDVSGELIVINISDKSEYLRMPLPGQPDSLKISPDQRFAAIVIENERDEEICVGGSYDAMEVPEDDDAAAEACESGGGEIGVIPQNGAGTSIGNPAGSLVVVDTSSWSQTVVDLTGLDGCFAPDDPEPEFVDVNEDNLAVVTLQENNCLVIVDLETATVQQSFDAGTVDLSQIDASEDEDVISLTESLSDVPREPDGVTWVPAANGESYAATANEGDLFGGSRGFSIFDHTGGLVFDSGNELEHIAVSLGHYPEARSANKGTEPEAVEFGSFASGDYLFVASERGSFVSVFELKGNAEPVYRQTLPAPLGPEGLLAIPNRNLLIASGEEDDPSLGVRSSIMIYRLERGQPDYPELESENDRNGTPIPWGAMSGMTAAPGFRGGLLAVWDSYYDDSRIFTIDASSNPARVTDSLEITDPRGIGAGNFDPEGIAVAPDGSYWIASEGNASGSRQNRLLHVNRWGELQDEVYLPAEIQICRTGTLAAIGLVQDRIEALESLEASGGLSADEVAELAELRTLNLSDTLGSGFEGVEVVPSFRGYRLLVAQQRGWDYRTDLNAYLPAESHVALSCEDLDDDQLGLNRNGEPNATRIWVYTPGSGTWGDSIAWELASLPANASWVGLSEITLAGSSIIVIERDNRTGDWTGLKSLVEIPLRQLWNGVAQAEKSKFDLLPAMRASNGWISDKPEGVAVDRLGRVYLVTDNDGVEDWSGETSFLELGNYHRLFR